MEQAAIDIMKPVFESSVYLAARYCKACGRDVVTVQDMEYGMKFAARNVLGKYTESFFPEAYEGEDSEEDSEEDSDETPFTRYEGTERDFLEMNECFDTWDSWTPESPAEILLKNAIDARIPEKEDDF
jgi:hypothetical protein